MSAFLCDDELTLMLVCGSSLAAADSASLVARIACDKGRLSRSQQVICEANGADGENGNCPSASYP